MKPKPLNCFPPGLRTASEIQDKIAGIAADIDLEYDPKISLVIYSEFEYYKNKEIGSPFVEDVEREGIPL